MTKTIFAVALLALLAGPVSAQQSGDQGAPSGADTSRSQDSKDARTSHRMGHTRSHEHMDRHHRSTRHHMRSGRHHARHHRHHHGM